jgi:hypothetical protein
MENKYIEKKIKKEFIKKDFANWDKNSIDLLILMLQLTDYKKYHNMLFLLLNDYIIWLNNNKIIKDNYSINELNDLKDGIFKELYYSNNDKNIEIYEYDSIINIDNISYAILLTILSIIFKYIFSLLFNSNTKVDNNVLNNNVLNNSLLNNNVLNNDKNFLDNPIILKLLNHFI